VWIWGYWTGRNIGGAVNGGGGVVGHTTDQNGIIGEVQLVWQNRTVTDTDQRCQQSLQAVPR